tara:strand:- start:303 stop:497 length:195 start_codon:yes stop_codon:yes gene_type:complete
MKPIKIYYGTEDMPLSKALRSITNGAIYQGYCEPQTIIDLRNACKELLKKNKELEYKLEYSTRD